MIKLSIANVLRRLIAFLNPFDDREGVERLLVALLAFLNRASGLLLLALIVLLVLWLRPSPPPPYEGNLRGDIGPSDFPALAGAAAALPAYPDLVPYYGSITNFGYPQGARGQNRPVAIVVHVAGGSCAGMRAWFMNPNSYASAHYGVCKDGRIEGYVLPSDAAWHAGLIQRPDLSNPLVYEWWRYGKNPNLYTIGIETELKPGERIEDYPAMWESLVRLVQWTAEAYGIPVDRDHIIGHHQIDGINRAQDPVCCLDLDRLVAEVRARQAPPPPPPVDWAALDVACRTEAARALLAESYERVAEVFQFCGRPVVLARGGGPPAPDSDLGKADAEVRLAAADRVIWREWGSAEELLRWWGVLR